MRSKRGICVLLGHSLEFFSFQSYFFCVLYFRHHINIKYILEITYGTLAHRKLTKQFFKQKFSFKPKVAGFGVASAVLVCNLRSINLGHERAR
jgi:hypothetical protein